MTAEIHDRGRGPEIKGTRITVYDVMDYYRRGYTPQKIAHVLRLEVKQVAAAIGYIDAHRGEVEAEHHKMLERDARGNTPEAQAKLDALTGSARRKRDELAAEQRGANGIGFTRRP